MRKPFRTQLLASLCSLPGVLFARIPTPLAQPVQETNAFAAWTPNQLKQTTTDVDLYIYFPWQGTNNWWSLEFVDGSGQSTYFTTDSNTAATGYLGTLPAGRYNLYYYALYGSSGSFLVDAGCGPWVRHPQGDSGSLFGCTINADCNYIAIEKY